jgi:hypothetical protein
VEVGLKGPLAMPETSTSEIEVREYQRTKMNTFEKDFSRFQKRVICPFN